MKYILSQEAEQDIVRIYQFGFYKFGEAQADKYYDAIYNCFDRKAHNPGQFPLASHVRERYRYCVCGSETIYFRLRKDDIPEIIRIIGMQDFLPG